jgi:hypothetical protein
MKHSGRYAVMNPKPADLLVAIRMGVQKAAKRYVFSAKLDKQKS